MNRVYTVIVLLVVGFAVPLNAQRGTVNDAAELDRLRDTAYLAERDLASLSQRDSSQAAPLQRRFEDLQDEIVYLKVKHRKDGFVPRREYADLHDRFEDLRAEARSASMPARSAAQRSVAPVQTVLEVPVGTEMDVRMSESLDSGTAVVEDRFEATTVADVHVGGRLAIPAGSVVRGVVTAVERGTRTNRTSRLTVSFDQVTINGQAHPIRGTVTEAIQGSGMKGEIGRTSAGAGAGALIGGLLGGVKGALVGVAIGGGGMLAATEGKEVRVPQGSLLRLRLDSPVQMYAAR
jgi:hypothetical protein